MSTSIPPHSPATVVSGVEFLGIEPPRLMLRPLLQLDEDQFFQLVAQNPEQPLEQNAHGEVVIMSPTGYSSGWRNSELIYQLMAWNKQHQRGIVFNSSTLFRFPNNAALSPDAAWVERGRWDRLAPEQKKSIPRLTPNFVIELRSETDRPTDLQDKLVEYMANGVDLGWIVDPLLKQVHIYEPGRAPRILDRPADVAGTGCVEGFVLDLSEIFAERDL